MAITTPDGRYIIVEGKAGPRLWRASNPNLSEELRTKFVNDLMEARRAVRAAKSDLSAMRSARVAIEAAKRALGERGPPWWDDGEPDLNRTLVKNSPYANWWVTSGGGLPGPIRSD